jgi:hypothetical protein
MLFEESVLDPKTRRLLKQLGGLLCGKGSKWEFFLVGVTALAIQLGHRGSIHLDFFGPEPFDSDPVVQSLSEWCQDEKFIVSAAQANTLNLSISGVKVDLITYAYDRLEPPIQAAGYTMLSLPDIAAMKLSAVCNRGSKKDFFDIAELLDHFELPELFDFYTRKFKSHDTFHVLRSLSYFEDAEDEPDPITLKAQT